MSESASIRVLCRFRPVNSREKREFIAAGLPPETTIVKFIDDFTCEIFLEEGLGSKKYNFDRVYPPGVPQRDVYNLAACDTVKQVLNGYNGTILTYGQTGAGKSFSMFGSDIRDPEMKGIIPRSGDHIFQYIAEQNNPDIAWIITCSFIEIYNESVNDLLARGPGHTDLKIRESTDKGIYVENAEQTSVTSSEDIMTVIAIGDANRAVSSTNMNAVSSRSHTIIIITVTQQNQADQSKQTGKMCLVDLAGSEKTSKTAAEGQRLKEANNINSSLTTLGQCIKMLADGGGKGHIPYRNSKLTRILQESLGGNSKTTLLIACSPHPFNREETISTCEFGKRAKTIKNKVKVNAVKSVKELMGIIDKLTQELQAYKTYTQLQRAVIEWYQKQHEGEVPGVHVPTEQDLAALIAGKQVGDAQAGGQEQNAENTVSYGAINDASARIADLQAKLDEANEKIRLTKEDCEADLITYKRALKEAESQGFQCGLDTHFDGDTIEQSQISGMETIRQATQLSNKNVMSSKEYELLKEKYDGLQERYNQMKQQLAEAMGMDIKDLESEESEDQYYEDYYEDEEEQENDGQQKPQQKKHEEKKQQHEQKEKAPMVIGVKKIQELNAQVQQLQEQIDQKNRELEEQKTKQQNEIQQLQIQIQQLTKDNNRLRGVFDEDNEKENENLDPKDKLIRDLEKEIKQCREIVLLQKNDLTKKQLDLEDLTTRYNKLNTVVQLNTEEVKQQVENTKYKQLYQWKMVEYDQLQERLKIVEERLAGQQKIQKKLGDQVTKLQKEKQDQKLQQDQQFKKLMSDFEIQKQKLLDVQSEKGNNLSQQLAINNPGILEKLKQMKSSWVSKDE